MNRTEYRQEFDPSGVAVRNGNFLCLPFTQETAKVVLMPVPWDVTVSYGEGTALAPHAILNSSVQLDLFDPDVSNAWKLGIYMQMPDQGLLKSRDNLRIQASSYIDFLESGGDVRKNTYMQNVLEVINSHCSEMNNWVFRQSKRMLDAGKLVGVVGGDHSVPLGYLKALCGKYNSFGILQLDAHMDLRDSYEGFTFSHASVFHNALKEEAIEKLVQVGIRDCCEEELEKMGCEGDRISVFFDRELKEKHFEGITWNEQCEKIVEQLPEQVYISVDIDGLDPKLCPLTGTPVPGGLNFSETVFLFKKVMESGRKIIGFDVCETGNGEWDGNVAARIIYKLCNFAGRSHGLI